MAYPIQSKKIRFKNNVKKISKIHQNNLITMVKFPAQKNEREKSYDQKTAQKYLFLKIVSFGQFFGHNFFIFYYF